MIAKIDNSVRFLRTTAIGGVLFLLPFLVVVVLLVYVYQGVAAIHVHLKPWIPFDSATGILCLFIVAILLLLALCFAAGLIARRAIGVHFAETIEKQLMKLFPKYSIYKDLIACRIGGQDKLPSLSPVLVKREDGHYLAFQADKLSTGQVVVYFPGSPDTWAGSIALIPAENVQAINLPFGDLLDICERMGRDSSARLHSAINSATSVSTSD